MVLLAEEKETAVRLEKIRMVRRDRAGSSVEILRGVSFSTRCGKISVVIGPSGGGKSSLIRLINRLEEPTSGKVYLGATDIVSLDPLQLRRQIALVPQKPYMFQGTVLENLQRPFCYRQEPFPGADSKEVQRVLTLARLDPELIEREARSLSLGEQQRVSLARALITHPQVLLLDEPTSALDRRTADQLGATFLDICRSQHLGVILVTHDLRLAGRVADYCLYLEGGLILEEGSAAEMLARPKCEELRRFLAEPSEREV